MYRIELKPGEVTVFRTIEELATGVRNGVISSKARIFHGATEKWLPIEFHPHYKAALALLSSGPVETAAAKPQERPSFDKLSFLNPPAATRAAASPAPVSLDSTAPVSDDVPPVANTAIAKAQPGQSQPRKTQPAKAQPVKAEPTVTASPSVADAPLAPARPSPIEQAIAASRRASGAHHAIPAEMRPTEPDGRRAETPQSHQPFDRTEPGYLPAGDSMPSHRAAAADQTQPVPRHDHAAAAEPESAGDELLIDHGFEAPPPPARPRPASVIERERPEPVVEAPSLTLQRSGRAPAATAVLAASEAAEQPVSNLPPVNPSPVLDLPVISYPEFIPADAPVAEPAAAAGRSRRPLQVAMALALLAIGGYGATLVLRTGRAAEVVDAERPVVPPAAAGAAIQPGAQANNPSATLGAAVAGPTAGIAPPGPRLASTTAAAVAGGPIPPASSGFAPALESRAIVKPAAPRDSAAAPTADSLPGIAPAPIDLDVPLPVVTSADSLVGGDRPQGDSTLKRILRAVNGGKDVPSKP